MAISKRPHAPGLKSIENFAKEDQYVTGFGKTDQVVTFCILRNTILMH